MNMGQYKYSLATRYMRGNFQGQYGVFATMKGALKICKQYNDKNNGWEWRVIHI